MTKQTKAAFEAALPHIGGRPVFAKAANSTGEWILVDAAELRDGEVWARCDQLRPMDAHCDYLPKHGEWFQVRDFEVD